MRVATLAVVSWLWATPARADEPPQAVAVLVGASTALVPFGVSATLLSRQGGLQDPRAAVFTLSAGLALAPIVAHAIVGEWDRAAIFGAVPVASAAGVVAVFSLRPDTFRKADRVARVSAGTLLTLLILSSGVGVIDCFFATERADVALVPSLDRGVASLSVGGLW